MAIVLDFGFLGKPVSGPAKNSSACFLCICLVFMLMVFFISLSSYDVYCLPLLRLWQGGMQFFTQPVLFCLVNVVILSLWASSGSTCNSAGDLMKEEELQPLSAFTKPSSQKCSSNYKDSLTAEIPCSCSQKDHAYHSESFSHLEVYPASRNWVELKSSQRECFTPSLQILGKGKATAAASESTCTSLKQHRASDHVKQYSTCRQDHCGTESSNNKRNKATQTSGETKTRLPNLGASEATKRPKLESRSASFPKVAPSRVVVRDMSMSSKAGPMKAHEIVMEKDELNERIEAFFARFREQLRRESLSN